MPYYYHFLATLFQLVTSLATPKTVIYDVYFPAVTSLTPKVGVIPWGNSYGSNTRGKKDSRNNNSYRKPVGLHYLHFQGVKKRKLL